MLSIRSDRTVLPWEWLHGGCWFALVTLASCSNVSYEVLLWPPPTSLPFRAPELGTRRWRVKPFEAFAKHLLSCACGQNWICKVVTSEPAGTQKLSGAPVPTRSTVPRAWLFPTKWWCTLIKWKCEMWYIYSVCVCVWCSVYKKTQVSRAQTPLL